jgi:hypothetical protein
MVIEATTTTTTTTTTTLTTTQQKFKEDTSEPVRHESRQQHSRATIPFLARQYAVSRKKMVGCGSFCVVRLNPKRRMHEEESISTAPRRVN